MSNYGFVYVLMNDAMPQMFKAGCTERSPHARADELSTGTAIPMGFEVVCYAEFENFQAVEKNLHTFLADYRVASNREFFWVEGINEAFAFLFWHPEKLAFCDVCVRQNIDGPFHSASELPSPWNIGSKDVPSNVVELTLRTDGAA